MIRLRDRQHICPGNQLRVKLTALPVTKVQGPWWVPVNRLKITNRVNKVSGEPAYGTTFHRSSLAARYARL